MRHIYRTSIQEDRHEKLGWGGQVNRSHSNRGHPTFYSCIPLVCDQLFMMLLTGLWSEQQGLCFANTEQHAFSEQFMSSGDEHTSCAWARLANGRVSIVSEHERLSVLSHEILHSHMIYCFLSGLVCHTES